MPERLTKLMKATNKHPDSKAFETLQKAEEIHCKLEQNRSVMGKDFIGRLSLNAASPIQRSYSSGIPSVPWYL